MIVSKRQINNFLKTSWTSLNGRLTRPEKADTVTKEIFVHRIYNRESTNIVYNFHNKEGDPKDGEVKEFNEVNVLF